MPAFLRREIALAAALAAAAAAYAFEPRWLAGGRTPALAAALALAAAVACASIRVAHHAARIARRLGDPYGTMVLTLSAVLVEVLILGFVMTDHGSPTLARDTIYSAVMLDINGILGLATLMGGLKHGEQAYNDDSGRTYGVMILTAMSISMVVPEFVPPRRWHVYSGFTIVAMATLYAGFLRMQTGPHSYFFSYDAPENARRPRARENAAAPPEPGPAPARCGPAAQETAGTLRAALLLAAGIAAIGALAEPMSRALAAGLRGSGAPPALVPVLVAALSAGPEILTALRAALANRMQSVVNIAMGASLSTVILTVPAMEALALFTGQPLQMAMTPVQTVMVFVTLVAAAINLNDGQTNAIEGMTHFVLFATFLALAGLGL